MEKIKISNNKILLENRGNMCYVNSALQVLLNIPALMEIVMQIDPKESDSDNEKRKQDKELIRELQRAFVWKQKKMNESYPESHKIAEIVFKNGNQNDTQELIQRIFNAIAENESDSRKFQNLFEIGIETKIYSTIKNQSDIKKFQDLFNGYETKMELNAKVLLSLTADPTNILDLHMPEHLEEDGSFDFSKLKEIYEKPEQLKGKNQYSYKGKLIDAEKKDEIVAPSPIFVVQLKRSFYNQAGELEKITNKSTLPSEIEIKNKKYKLFAFQNHRGSINSGHYVTYLNNKILGLNDIKNIDDSNKENFLYFSDSECSVEKFSDSSENKQNIAEDVELFGQPYMYYYIEEDKEKEIFKKEIKVNGKLYEELCKELEISSNKEKETKEKEKEKNKNTEVKKKAEKDRLEKEAERKRKEEEEKERLKKEEKERREEEKREDEENNKNDEEDEGDGTKNSDGSGDNTTSGSDGTGGFSSNGSTDQKNNKKAKIDTNKEQYEPISSQQGKTSTSPNKELPENGEKIELERKLKEQSVQQRLDREKENLKSVNSAINKINMEIFLNILKEKIGKKNPATENIETENEKVLNNLNKNSIIKTFLELNNINIENKEIILEAIKKQEIIEAISKFENEEDKDNKVEYLKTIIADDEGRKFLEKKTNMVLNQINEENNNNSKEYKINFDFNNKEMQTVIKGCPNENSHICIKGAFDPKVLVSLNKINNHNIDEKMKQFEDNGVTIEVINNNTKNVLYSNSSNSKVAQLVSQREQKKQANNSEMTRS